MCETEEEVFLPAVSEQHEDAEEEEEEEFVDAVDAEMRAAALKEEGNVKFRSGDFEAAYAAYSSAIDVDGGGDTEVRSAALCNRAACAVKLGKPRAEIIADCTAAIELRPDYIKAYIRRSQAYEAEDKLDDAIADLEKANEIEASPQRTKELDKLKQKRTQRDEKLKEEALGKLKDLGNTFLGNFGLSLDNFQFQQSENGSYNISYNNDAPSSQ